MTLSAIDMCVQLGRFLGRELNDIFVESDSSDQGNIYASPLPALKYRKAYAVSIVPQPSATDEPMAVTQRMAIVLHSTAPGNSLAMEMLGAYASKLWRNNRPGVLIEGDYKPGIIGVPTQVGTHAVWRIIEIRQLDHPQIKPRTEEGQAAAGFALEVHAVQTTVEVSAS